MTMINQEAVQSYDYVKKLNLILNVILGLAVILALLNLAEPTKILAANFLEMENAEVLVLFIGMLFMVNLYRELGNIADYFLYWTKFVKDSRLSLVATSMALGILPVKGRTIVSAPIIGQIAQKNKLNKMSAALVDYLATHTVYYLLPIEGSVVVVLGTFAAIGYNLGTFISYMLPGVAVLLTAVTFYSWKSTATAEKLTIHNSNITFAESLRATAPMALLMIALYLFEVRDVRYSILIGVTIFIGLSILLLKPSKEQIISAVKKMDQQLIITLVLIFLFSATVSQLPQIGQFAGNWLSIGLHLAILGGIAYVIGFLIGDSKGMTLVTFPILVPFITQSAHPFQIISIVYAALYAGYVASPAHPCCHYAASYFDTPYFKVWSRISLVGLLSAIAIISVALIRG